MSVSRILSFRWLYVPLFIFCGVALFVFLTGRIPYPDARYSSGDQYRYIPMAIQPFTNPNPLAHQPPFVWRILTPLLVHMLPVPTLTGFWLVTLFGLAGTVLALPWLLKALGVPQPAIIGGTLAFVFLGPATGFSLWSYQRIDALAFFLLTLALLFSVQRRGLLLVATLCVLSFDKEVSLFGAVFSLAWAWQHRDNRMIRWSVVALVGSLGILFALHTIIPANRPYSLLGEFENLMIDWLKNGTFPARLQVATIGTWGILFPLAVWHLWHPASLWKRHACWLLLLLATAQIFVSGDIERVVVYAFPVMIAASSFTVEEFMQRWHVSRWILWIPIYLLEVTWLYIWAPIYPFTLTGIWHSCEVLLIILLAVATLVWPLFNKVRRLKQGAGVQVT